MTQAETPTNPEIQRVPGSHYIERSLSEEITADVLGPVLGDVAGRFKLVVQGEMTPEEYHAVFGGNLAQYVTSMKRITVCKEEWTIRVSLDDATEPAYSWILHLVHTVNNRLGLPNVSDQEYKLRVRNHDDISPNTVACLLELLAYEEDDPDNLALERVYEVIDKYGITIDDLLRPAQ